MNEEQTEALRKFAVWVLDEVREGINVDGGEAQEQAVMLGLLLPARVTEPCGDGCNCAEYDNIPGECFRDAPFLAAPASPVEEEQ